MTTPTTPTYTQEQYNSMVNNYNNQINSLNGSISGLSSKNAELSRDLGTSNMRVKNLQGVAPSMDKVFTPTQVPSSAKGQSSSAKGGY